MVQTIHRIVIESRAEATVMARHWVAHRAHLAGFKAESIFGIELALGEALANVIEHAYHRKSGKKIYINLEIDETRLKLTIRDFGRQFQPEQLLITERLNVPSEEGGYGLYLMHKLMDEVTYVSLPEGTELSLVKYQTPSCQAIN